MAKRSTAKAAPIAAGADDVEAIEPLGAIHLLPLARLKLHPGNTRKAGTREQIEALAASIEAHGLINNLVGTPDQRGSTEFVWIIAGGRRLAALQMLARKRRWPASQLVPVLVRADDEITNEASLAENIMRQALSPLAEARAFALLVDDGADDAGVAARFGTTVRHVRQRLRLAALSPRVAKALEDGRITLDAAQAFASIDDHAAQDAVLKSASQYDLANPRTLRTMLCGAAEGLRGSHVFCWMVGRDAFLAAGGEIAEDLFSDAGDTVWRPASLVDQLYEQALAAARDAVVERHGFAGWLDDWPNGARVDVAGLTERPAEERARIWIRVGPSPYTENSQPGFVIQHAFIDVVPDDDDDAGDEAPPPAAATERPAAAPEPADDATAAMAMPKYLSAMLAMRRRDCLAWALASASDYAPAIKLATFLLIERGPLGERGDHLFRPGTSITAQPLDEPLAGGANGHSWAGDPLDQARRDALAGGDLPLPADWRSLADAAARFAAFCELDFIDVLRWQAVAVAASLKSGPAITAPPALHDAIAAQLATAGVEIDVASLWRPDADFFRAIGKPGCLAMLSDCLGRAGPADVGAWAKWKLAELAVACAALADGDSSKLGGLGGMAPTTAEAAGRAWLPPGMAFGEGTVQP
jgi:ParB family chromosome partitioning protein